MKDFKKFLSVKLFLIFFWKISMCLLKIAILIWILFMFFVAIFFPKVMESEACYGSDVYWNTKSQECEYK